MSISLFTSGALRKIEVEAVTSEAAGHPIEHALDFCLDTYWKPTTTGNQTIDFDLQAAHSFTGVALWMHNYDTDHAPDTAPDFEVFYSDNGSDWTSFVAGTFYVVIKTLGYMNVGLLLLQGITVQTHRWWRFVFRDMATTIEISQFLLIQEFTVPSAAYPRPNAKGYGNVVTQLHNNARASAAGSSLPFYTFSRTWNLFLQADHDALENAYDDCYGNRFPCIIEEATGEHKLVYITSPQFNPSLRDHQVWDLTLGFADVPYIPDGEAY